MIFWEVLGDQFRALLVLIVVKKSECFKQGSHWIGKGMGRAGPGAVAPLKESKEARHLRSQTATQRLKHSTRVPSGTVPD